MKKKILQILIVTAMAFVGLQQVQAMVTCSEAQGDEACSLIPQEELEQIEIENQAAGNRSQITLPTTADSSAPGVTLIHQSPLTKVDSSAKQAFPVSPWKQYRSPLSKVGI